MKKKVFIRWFVLTWLLVFCTGTLLGQARQMEALNRGIVRLRVGSSNFISWRLLGHESLNTAFNLYRDGTKLNSSPLTGATFYTDTAGSDSSIYSVKAVSNGSEIPSSETAFKVSGSYHAIPLSPPGPNHASDASVGDLDGDGEYEIILKWEADNSKDNSQSGVTNNVYLDAYKLSGRRMWRINLGRNIRAGAHYTQFIVYDLDGDGKAEVACKTADGTVDGTGKVIGDPNADWRNSGGYILTGPEFLTVFSGPTGAALATANYLPARGTVSSWGDSYGNRVDRFLAGVGYFDGQKPSLLMTRGYYTRSVLAAWDFRNGSLVSRWVFDTNNGYSAYAGQGNHNLSIADVDEDGRDEVLFGSMAVDDNGKGLWNSRLGHGDAMHVSDIDPNRPGLEIWGIHENANVGSALLDARTGTIIWGTGAGDVGRGVAADVNGSIVGMECWGGTSGLRSATNQSAGSTPSSSNHVIWWDGDLQRELLNGTSITKYGGGTLLSATGTSSNNSTKSNPCLQVDLWGDWREEVIFRASDNSQLRIYTTTTSTTYRLRTLMHDSQYRVSIAWQNVAYNQSPHTGFYLGGGMKTPPDPAIYYPTGSVTPPPTPPPTTPPTPAPTPTPVGPGTYTLEAEDAYFSSGIVESTHAGFSGIGYVNTGNESGAAIEWSINSLTAEKAVCRFIYANGGTDRPMSLMVNGNTTAQSLSFPTGDWTAWGPVLADINLNKGLNLIRLTSLTAEGAPNMDRLEITIGSSGKTGDVNGDGAVNIIDALMTAQYYVGLNPQPFNTTLADVNKDGAVNIIDALIIAQHYVGLIVIGS